MFSKNIRKNLDQLKNDIASIEAELESLDRKSASNAKPPLLQTKAVSKSKPSVVPSSRKNDAAAQTSELKKNDLPRKESYGKKHCPCKKEVVKTISCGACGDCSVKLRREKKKTRNCCDCDSDSESVVSHVHHQICIPLEALRPHKEKDHKRKSHRDKEGKRGLNETWEEILFKKSANVKRKDLPVETTLRSGETGARKQREFIGSEEKQEDNIQCTSKELEEKNKAIEKLHEQLQRQEKSEANMKAAMSQLQEELEELQEAQEKARLEAQLKTLREEKMKALLAAKDVILENVLRSTEALDEKLQQQRDYDRKVAANLEVENALLALKTKFPYIDMSSISTSPSTPVKAFKHKRSTSTPTSSITSSDKFNDQSWMNISKIDVKY